MGEMADYVNDVGGYGDVYWPVKKKLLAFQKVFKIGDKCDCGGLLVLRTNSITNTKFLGCNNFPKCKKSKSYRKERV